MLFFEEWLQVSSAIVRRDADCMMMGGQEKYRIGGIMNDASKVEGTRVAFLYYVTPMKQLLCKFNWWQ
jgi:hypothetical protein